VWKEAPHLSNGWGEAGSFEWQLVDGGWSMMDDGWWMMDGGWWVMDGGWWMVGGVPGPFRLRRRKFPFSSFFTLN
jgi:hypothetical protein